VNLAPADIRKDGSALDLPIALGLLVASGQLPEAGLQGTMVLGEIGLEGDLRPVRGALQRRRPLHPCRHNLSLEAWRVCARLSQPDITQLMQTRPPTA
jgi:magnesium chelatase family protein